MTVLMSFKPSVFNKIIDQIKIIEYRRNFPKNCSYAYMYVSKPVQAICGIIYFGNNYSLLAWQNEYKKNEIIFRRVNNYINKYRFGTEIIGIQRIKPISLKKLEDNLLNFSPPQSYYILENNIPLKKFIENNIIKIGKKLLNNTTNIFPEHICKEY